MLLLRPFLQLRPVPEVAVTHPRLELLTWDALANDWFNRVALDRGRWLLRETLSNAGGLGVIGWRLSIALQDRLEPLDEPAVDGLVVRHLNLAH